MSRLQDAPGAAALRVAVFLSGGVLLGIEIVASRVLAPSFGSSLYVWGSLIGVVLTGLAIGYWAGGALSDRYPTPYLLTGTLALGASLVLLIPVLDGWVIDRVVSWDPGPRLDPLLASIALFAPVSIVLAAATPIAVRLAARSLDRLGRTAGRLFSVSTAGSIVGTFVTAFWLVPELGTDQVLAVGAVTLLVAATAYALAERLLAAVVVLVLATAAAAVVVTNLAPEESVRLQASELQNWSPVYRERERRDPGKLSPDAVAELGTEFVVREARDTRYHRMFVLDDEDQRYLRFDNTFQSAMQLDDPYATVFTYTDYLQLGLAYAPTTRNVLFIGLGGGSAVKRMWRDFPSLRLHAVEVDPDVDPCCATLLPPATGLPPRGLGPGRASVSPDERRAVGHDRDRRLLFRLDSVPPRNGPVLRARALATLARRRRGLERDRGRHGTEFAASALDDEDVPRRLPDRGASSGRR